jgi:spore coat polysaccharide biosynthesis protein SpsF
MSGSAIVLQARMSSTRLPGKALAYVAGLSVLAHCVERLRFSSGLPVVLATSTAAADDSLCQAGERLGITVVRGDAEDVLGRFVQVATTLGLTDLVRATCDNPAVDMDSPRRTLELLRRTGADYVVEFGLPYGAAVEAVSVLALLRAAAWTSDPYDREHVTPFVRRDKRFAALHAIAPRHLRRPELRLSVDTAEDLEFVRSLFAAAEATSPRPVTLAALMSAAHVLQPAGAGDGLRDAR